MRRITTINGQPESFNDWLNKNGKELEAKLLDPDATGDDIWTYFRNNEKVYYNLKTVLIEDQGFICCYCGQRIEDNFHTSIEHLQPKTIYKHLTLDFDNLLASCSGGSNNKIHVVEQDETLETIADKYGVSVEHLEDVYVNIDEVNLFRKRYDIENLSEGDRIVIIPKAHSSEQHCDTKKNKSEIEINPLQDDCTDYFSYNPLDGTIQITEDNKSTVDVLGLNSNRYINQLRKKTLDNSIEIKEYLMNDFGHSKTEFENNRRRFIDNLNKIVHPGEKLEPFVFVIIWSLNN